jgi:hypothetical protein
MPWSIRSWAMRDTEPSGTPPRLRRAFVFAIAFGTLGPLQISNGSSIVGGVLVGCMWASIGFFIGAGRPRVAHGTSKAYSHGVVPDDEAERAAAIRGAEVWATPYRLATIEAVVMTGWVAVAAAFMVVRIADGDWDAFWRAAGFGLFPTLGLISLAVLHRERARARRFLANAAMIGDERRI